MKYFRIFLIPILGIITCLSACLKSVEFSLPEHKPALVLNSVFNPDSIFTVDLSSSRDIFSNENFVPVKNASVRLFSNGNYLAEFRHSKNGVYEVNIKPESLKKYTITATAPGFTTITAQNYVPAQPVVTQVQATASYYRDNTQLGVNIFLTLNDPSIEEDYYFITAYQVAQTDSGRTYIYRKSVTFLSPIEEDFRMGDREFFSDKLFQGKPTNFKFYLDSSPQLITYLQLAHITKEYYNYGKILVNSSSEELDKRAVPNNIENGMGLFAGYNSIVIPIKP